MGAQISSTIQLADNTLLRRFTGLEPITENDPFWNQLLSFNFCPPTNRYDAKFFEETTNDLMESLMYNTSTTKNFYALTKVFLIRAAELKTSTQCDDKLFIWHTSNVLIILRHTCKFFAQRLNADELKKFFYSGDNLTAVDDGNTAVDEFLSALIEILVDLPINNLTTRLHFEALNCLISLLTCELFIKQARPSVFLNILMHGKCSIHAPILTRILLQNFVSEDAVLEHLKNNHYGGGSVILGLAASFVNVLQWGYGDGDENNKNLQQTLSSQSLFALLILSCHRGQMMDVQQSTDKTPVNPYRQALFAFHNSQEVSTLTLPTSSVATFKFDYSALYEKLCSKADQEPCLLLLYLLVHRNSGFRNFILSRVNIETLLFPILKVLRANNTGHGDNKPDIGLISPDEATAFTDEQCAEKLETCCDSHHVYLALILLLIFSEDEFFCKVVHETTVGNLSWFSKTRVYNELSLGGLIILVLLKSIQYNAVKTRDRYLQTNCLAALANMSSNFKQLHPQVCQQFISLLEQLCKKHARVVESIGFVDGKEFDSNSEANGENLQTITALEEAMRMLMEILNSCLTHNLRNNPQLIYTMMYRRDLFDSFQNHPMFQDLLWNIGCVLNHFASRLSTLDKNANSSEVLTAIQQGALQWPTDRLKRFPELKFKYVEDTNTEDFFVPYIWSLVFRLSGFYWQPTKIKLFDAKTVKSAVSSRVR